MRQVSIETSTVIVQNVSYIGHTGLITLKMHNGIIQRVWAGTPAGLLLWDAGRTVVHIVQNVDLPLTH